MRTKQLQCFLTAVLVLLLFSFAAQGKGRPFITRWKGEAGKELYIPIKGENYKLVIKKADGTVLKTETSLTGVYRYIPTKSDELIVEAGPEGVTAFASLYKRAEALLYVEQFGTVQWQTMQYAFYGCKNMQFASGIDTPDLSKVTNMQAMFSRCTSFNQPLNNWDVSKVTDMSYMFSGCTSFNQPLNNWDVSKVTNMNDMFRDCTSFNQPLNSWDVSKVDNMSNMFSGCTSFNQDLGMWRLEQCRWLGLRNCGMSAENYGKSLEGWAAQTNIRSRVELEAAGLKYFPEATESRKKLINKKSWSIIGDVLLPYYISFETGALTLTKGAVHTLVLTKKGIDENETVMLTSSAPTTVRIIDATSLTIKGLKTGKATITATVAANGSHEKLVATCEVFVTIPVSGVTLSQTKLPLLKGSTAKLTATVLPTDATNKKVRWSSTNTAVATVENGIVTAVSAGNAIITVTTEDGNHTARCEVMVTVPVTGVMLSQTELPLVKGATATLTATVIPSDATNQKVTWSSNNTSVATVENGTVTAVSGGAATITATTEDGNHTAICEVTVTVSATGVTLSQTELSLVKGATATLTATVLPTDATNQRVSWRSNNATVATVENGTITAVSAGNATITVITEDGNHTATCEVTVTVSATGVTLSQTELPLVKGATATLTATVVPSDATNQKVRWSSNNTPVVTVENGTVTAISAGNATITLTTEDGNHTATCEVTVTVPATGVTLSQTELPLVKGATATLSATVVPADATNKQVTWSSTNTAVAIVENGTVTAVSGGAATITVTTEDGNHTATCEVTVTVPVTGVTLSQTELPLLKGATAGLTATVSPPDATNQKVTWSSNNTAVATVENGTVTAVSAGNATITVTTEDGNHTARCEVTVTVSATGVTLSQTELSLAKGAKATLRATVVPSDATNQKVRWSSNNTSIATVENGTVTAVSGGNATITVTTEDGNHTARCEVVVTAPVPAASVTLSQTELILRKGATAKLTATVLPTDATNKKVRWSSNNTAVAIVESGTVAALSAGNATITVTTEDGNHTATCSVAVEATSAVEDAVFASVVVSPNPFGEQLCITYGDLRGQYVLYNAQGVVVASGGLEDGETRINTVSFTAGVYLLRLTAENGATKNYTVVKD